MIREYAEGGKKKNSATLNLTKANTEVLIAFGNELAILNLLIKYAKDFGGEEMVYWSRFNPVVAEDLSISEHTVKKHLGLFINFGILSRKSTGYYAFNKDYIKIK